MRAPTVDLSLRPLVLDRPRAPMRLRPRHRPDIGLLLVVALAVAVGAWLAWSFWRATRVDVTMTGLDAGAVMTPAEAAALSVAIRLPDDDLHAATLQVDGVDLLGVLDPAGNEILVQPLALVDQELVPGALTEGRHEIELSVPRVILGDSTFHWSYVVDGTAPRLVAPSALEPVDIDEPVTVTGEVEEGALLRLNGEPVPSIDDGRFELDFEFPPARPLELVAEDEAGNRTTVHVTVPVRYPSDSAAVHVSAAAWRFEPLREGVLDLLDRGLIDTVELDLKDEAGVIGYDSELPLARRIGAVRSEYDLEEAVEELEARGARVIGRIVAFRDPVYAAAMWAEGKRDQVIQTPAGEMLGVYGGFSNYVHPAVRQYNLDIALEAVDMGVRDILWDYVRRPDGHPSTMVVPGLGSSSSVVEVSEFLAETHEALRRRGAFQGASVFGIAADRPDVIGQDIPTMARHVEYLAPMIYPSHWVDGEYGVDSPIHQPYDITYAALADFQEKTAGTGVRFLPWIQDFTHRGVAYGPAEVRAQIDAARALGIEGFLVWNATVRYQADGLPPVAGR